MGSADEADERIGELVRILAKVAAGDYSEKPEFSEGEDSVSKFALAVRFMVDDLESAREQDRERREELESANARLRDLSDMKTRFINSAAHELNTPLTPISLQLRLLRTGKLGPLTPKQQTSVEMLERNLERLSHLVSDVLDAARLQSEHMRLNLAPRDVGVLAREAMETMSLQAEVAGVELEGDLTEAGPLVVDGHRITQVLVNLISNALKFTPRGGTIRLTARRDDHRLRVSVHDSGAGMTREQTERLFLPFSQVHDPTQHIVGGTGLGLFISRGIVEQHGGRIWCESDGPGRGATFSFEIPVDASLPRGEVHFPTPASPAKLT